MQSMWSWGARLLGHAPPPPHFRACGVDLESGVSPKPGAENIICAGRQTKTICAILPSNCEQGPCGSSYSGIKQGMNLRTLLCIRSSCEPLGCGLRIRDWSFPESLPTTTCLRS